MPKKGQFKPGATADSIRQRKFNSSTVQKKRRAERNHARAVEAKKGRVHKGDGKDVDHTNHDTTSLKHLKVTSVKANRSKNQYDKRKFNKANTSKY